MKNLILTTFVAILTFTSISKATDLKAFDGLDENALNSAAVVSEVVKCSYIAELTPAMAENFFPNLKIYPQPRQTR